MLLIYELKQRKLGQMFFFRRQWWRFKGWWYPHSGTLKYTTCSAVCLCFSWIFHLFIVICEGVCNTHAKHERERKRRWQKAQEEEEEEEAKEREVWEAGGSKQTPEALPSKGINPWKAQVNLDTPLPSLYHITHPSSNSNVLFYNTVSR